MKNIIISFMIITLMGCSTLKTKAPQIEAPVFYPDAKDLQRCPMPSELVRGDFGEFVRGFNEAVEIIKECEVKRANLVEMIKNNNSRSP